MQILYRIRVKGQLDTSWSDRMGGMRITILRGPSGAETVLEGKLLDQAALQGVIFALGDLNLALVSVEPMELEGSR